MKQTDDQSGIIRVKHDNAHPYKTINTSFANDERLTWASRGLLVYLLSKPDDWKVVVTDLVKQSPAGRDAVYAILKNLEDNGYLQRIRTRRPDGTFEHSTVIYEKPEPLTAFPEAVQPEAVQPETENPDIYLVRKELTKDQLTKESTTTTSSPPSVNARLAVHFQSPKQVKRFIAAAETKRGSFTLADCDIVDQWLEQETYGGKYGVLNNILADGELPAVRQHVVVAKETITNDEAIRRHIEQSRNAVNHATFR